MSMEWHFLRPWWLLCLIPLILVCLYLWRKKPSMDAWRGACDEHLLKVLIEKNSTVQRGTVLLCLSSAALLMCLSLAGPAFKKISVPAYQTVQPRILVLDMSDNMLFTDLKPDRLTRARFKLHDLLQHHPEGQFGLVVFSGESFTVSPLTEDANTIDSLLPSLTPDVLPLKGHNPVMALNEAAALVRQSGYQHAQILLLTATVPDEALIHEAGKLSLKGLDVSVMPITESLNDISQYQALAEAGHGRLISFSAPANTWFEGQTKDLQAAGEAHELSVWRDDGWWLIGPALVLLAPVFRRGWLQRMDV